jgi:hypothetical protein
METANLSQLKVVNANPTPPDTSFEVEWPDAHAILDANGTVIAYCRNGFIANTLALGQVDPLAANPTEPR